MLKKITEAMKDLVTEANFDCSSTGISLQAMVRARHLRTHTTWARSTMCTPAHGTRTSLTSTRTGAPLRTGLEPRLARRFVVACGWI